MNALELYKHRLERISFLLGALKIGIGIGILFGTLETLFLFSSASFWSVLIAPLIWLSTGIMIRSRNSLQQTYLQLQQNRTHLLDAEMYRAQQELEDADKALALQMRSHE